jgi:hypothetical protein
MFVNLKQPNRTAYVKEFPLPGISQTLWTTSTYNNDNSYLTTTTQPGNVYISGNLVVQGSISNPSDLELKEQVKDIDVSHKESILSLAPKQFCYKSDKEKTLHFGFIAQDVEVLFPNLVKDVILESSSSSSFSSSSAGGHKVVNYLELIPLLFLEVKRLSTEVEFLRSQLDIINEK